VSPNQTLRFGGSPINDSAKLYCIRRASTTSFFDEDARTIGRQSSGGNITTLFIAPSTSNDLHHNELGVAANTMGGVTGAGQLFDSCLWSQESTGFGGCDEKNAWASYLNADTSAVTFTYAEFFSGIAASGWVSRSDSFEAAVVSGSQPAPPTDLTAIIQ